MPEADQRLIYGGKVLTDAQTLEDIEERKGAKLFTSWSAAAAGPGAAARGPDARRRRSAGAGPGDAAAPGSRHAGDAAAATTIDADHRLTSR